jgi:hypothetical protein
MSRNVVNIAPGKVSNDSYEILTVRKWVSSGGKITVSKSLILCSFKDLFFIGEQYLSRFSFSLKKPNDLSSLFFLTFF